MYIKGNHRVMSLGHGWLNQIRVIFVYSIKINSLQEISPRPKSWINQWNRPSKACFQQGGHKLKFSWVPWVYQPLWCPVVKPTSIWIFWGSQGGPTRFSFKKKTLHKRLVKNDNSSNTSYFIFCNSYSRR